MALLMKLPPPPPPLLLLPPPKKLPIPLTAPLIALPMLPKNIPSLPAALETEDPPGARPVALGRLLGRSNPAICAICILASVVPEELNGITYELPTLSLEMYSRP